MNSADARRTGEELERLGYRPASRPDDADLVIVNSCVVRQSAEDKVVGRLHALRAVKARRPETRVVLMGCLVGDIAALQRRFPHVDLFLRPSDIAGLVAWLEAPSPFEGEGWGEGEISRPAQIPSAPYPTLSPQGRGESGSVSSPSLVEESKRREGPISAEIAAMMGCDRHCTYCIVRLRRGPGRSRPLADIVAEAEALVRAGVREITLLGQNIDAYGRDLPDRPTLADLLRRVHDIPGLIRLRFLTSHPADLDDEVIAAVAELPRVCPHWELPVQSGDDEVLRRMGRGHTAADYLALVERIRARLPGASIATDIIVGFPGETAAQFERTLDLIRQVRFDAVHVACYSVRPGTPAARLQDDVPPAEKERRRRAVEQVQEAILTEANARLLGQEVEILVEGQHKGKWKGRTPSNKLVFFPHSEDWTGRLATVRITRTGPWSLQGEAQAAQNPVDNACKDMV